MNPAVVIRGILFVGISEDIITALPTAVNGFDTSFPNVKTPTTSD